MVLSVLFFIVEKKKVKCNFVGLNFFFFFDKEIQKRVKIKNKIAPLGKINGW